MFQDPCGEGRPDALIANFSVNLRWKSILMELTKCKWQLPWRSCWCQWNIYIEAAQIRNKLSTKLQKTKLNVQWLKSSSCRTCPLNTQVSLALSPQWFDRLQWFHDGLQLVRVGQTRLVPVLLAALNLRQVTMHQKLCPKQGWACHDYWHLKSWSIHVNVGTHPTCHRIIFCSLPIWVTFFRPLSSLLRHG